MRRAGAVPVPRQGNGGFTMNTWGKLWEIDGFTKFETVGNMGNIYGFYGTISKIWKMIENESVNHQNMWVFNMVYL